MYSDAVAEDARTLYRNGLTQGEVASHLGVSQTSVSRWVRRVHRTRDGRPPQRPACPRCDPSVTLDASAYRLLLGFYLGDGHISAHPHRRGTHAFSIVQDSRYPASVDEISAAMAAVFGTSVYSRKKAGAIELRTWSRHALCLFPQHGPGRKHERVITLEPWQRTLVEADPRPFLRGLFHSDGCRSINTIHRRLPSGTRTYRYPRYLFANESDDILRLCEWALDLVGVAHRRNRPNSVSVARREAVAVLDTFIGPKH